MTRATGGVDDATESDGEDRSGVGWAHCVSHIILLI